MAKIYNDIEHTWVMVNHPKITMEHVYEDGAPKWGDEGWKGPIGIVMYTGERVWIQGCYSMEGHPEVKRVGDDLSNGYDDHGNCILSVPASWCTNFYNDKEAEDIMECMDADERLLGYAL